jgi:hypothetical protein
MRPKVSWFRLTTTSGASVYLNADNCLRVRANTGEHGDHAESIIDLVEGVQVAMQAPEEVMEAIMQSNATNGGGSWSR